MRIYNHTNQIKHLNGVTLNIGPNEIDEDQWSKALEHPITKHLVEMGEVEAEEGDLGDISEITPISKAVSIIEMTFDQEKLAEWKDQDDRKGVQKAIDDQLEKLKEEERQEEGE